MKTEERNIQVNGRDCSLTRMEYDLYEWMRQNPGRVVSRDALLRNVWGFASQGDTRSVDMCVKRLRAKIGFDTIRTIYGKGYVLTV